MPTPADSPLRKVTLNLYDEDVAEYQRIYSEGWSVQLRELFHHHVQTVRRERPRRTLGDLE